MYCPSSEGVKIFPFWKVSSGKKTRGMNVPNIWRKSNAMAILVVRENRNVTPIATSHNPIATSQNSGVPNGNHTTVAFSRLSADERSKGFNIPNQIKMIPNDNRIALILQRLIHLAI
jgi:hypothetical protein